eukprot:m.279428 g.279428  ORF g.279428 m.279428 type:complete len:622 (-) comp16323_c3_seq3:45-1910(-)
MDTKPDKPENNQCHKINRILPEVCVGTLIPLHVAVLIALLVTSSEFWKQPAADEWIWTGAVTNESFVVSVYGYGTLIVTSDVTVKDTQKLDNTKVVFETAVKGHKKITVGNLLPNTRYYCTLLSEGKTLNDSLDIYKVKTFSSNVQARTKIAFASCASTGSTSDIFEEIADGEYDFFIHMGDMHYENVNENNVDKIRHAFRMVHGSDTQRKLFQSMPVYYMWDDHDFGPDESDKFSTSRSASLQFYKEWVPHPPLQNSSKDGPVGYAFTVGRIRIVIPDLRSEMAPNGDIMSPEQMSWFLGEIGDANKYALLIVFLGTPWIGDEKRGDDGWFGHIKDRERVSKAIHDVHLEGNGLGGHANIVAISGDAHIATFDNGKHTNYYSNNSAIGAFPLVQAGPLDRPGKAKGGPYTTECHGYQYAFTHQYASMIVNDNGSDKADSICILFRLHQNKNIVFESEMCGPLLTETIGGDVDCVIEWLPQKSKAIVVSAVVFLFLEVIVVCVYICCRSHTKPWLRTVVVTICLATLVIAAIQLALLAKGVTRYEGRPYTEPAEAFQNILIVALPSFVGILYFVIIHDMDQSMKKKNIIIQETDQNNKKNVEKNTKTEVKLAKHSVTTVEL